MTSDFLFLLIFGTVYVTRFMTDVPVNSSVSNENVTSPVPLSTSQKPTSTSTSKSVPSTTPAPDVFFIPALDHPIALTYKDGENIARDMRFPASDTFTISDRGIKSTQTAKCVFANTTYVGPGDCGKPESIFKFSKSGKILNVKYDKCFNSELEYVPCKNGYTFKYR